MTDALSAEWIPEISLQTVLHVTKRPVQGGNAISAAQQRDMGSRHPGPLSPMSRSASSMACLAELAAGNPA